MSLVLLFGPFQLFSRFCLIDPIDGLLEFQIVFSIHLGKFSPPILLLLIKGVPKHLHSTSLETFGEIVVAASINFLPRNLSRSRLFHSVSHVAIFDILHSFLILLLLLKQIKNGLGPLFLLVLGLQFPDFVSLGLLQFKLQIVICLF